MAKNKTQFLIVHGASVVVVRDGKRKTINPGQGENFTEEEITAVAKAAPGALRKPVNEGHGRSTVEDVEDEDTDDDEDDGDDDDDDADDEAPPAPAAKPAAKGKGKGKKPASEDEDI